MKRLKLSSQAGFTIVELMVALSVLSTILVMSTVIMIQINALYSKGVNSANLQNTTRSITADIASVLQFNGEDPTSCAVADGVACYATGLGPGGNPTTVGMDGVNVNIYAYCIGATRYSFVLNRELGTDPYAGPGQDQEWGTTHVLWRDTMNNAAEPCKPLDLRQDTPTDSADSNPNTNKDGYEMMGHKMRLTRFKVTPATDTPPRTYSIDIWAAFGDSDLVQTQKIDPAHPENTPGLSICKSGQGTQFCATSMLTTSATRRVKVQ